MSPPTPFPIRQACPPGACDCRREQLLESSNPDIRILQLNKEEEKRLIEHIERISSLKELRFLLKRMSEQLGIQLRIERGHHEVRTVRGLNITFEPQAGLCKKTKQTVPAAIRRALDANHHIVYELLDEESLFK